MTLLPRTMLALAVALGMLVLTPTASWACSCAGISTAEQVQRAGTVVDGTLEWVATNGMESTYSVKVDHVYKGKAAEREKLVGPASEAACGLGSFADQPKDQKYLFFIDGVHPGSMKVNLCNGSAPYDARTASAVQAITGAPSGPTENPVLRDGPLDEDPINGTHWTTILFTGFAVVAALGALLWFGGRRRG